MKTKHLWWWIGGAGLVLVLAALAAALLFLFREPEREWTTRSNAALEEFELGLDAMNRLYDRDAVLRFERALELDPRLAAARVFLSDILPQRSPMYREQIAALAEVDLGKLNPRERFLVRHRLAKSEGEEKTADDILNDYLNAHPEDFYGKKTHCDQHWQVQEWDAASACYSELLEYHPNWVLAYERLGFIAMAQGHFTEAEDHFTSYRYIAPEQPQAYVSLAELLILLGRHDEAETQIERALEIDPGHCAAYRHLSRNYYFSGQKEAALAALERWRGVRRCAELDGEGAFCVNRAYIAFFNGELDEAWSIFADGCLEKRHGYNIVAYPIALATGHLEEAAAMRERFRGYYEVPAHDDSNLREWYEATSAYFDGLERLFAGDYQEAGRYLGEADRKLRYWNRELASFKLFNRTLYLTALEAAGDRSEAKAVRKRIEAVNPDFVEHMARLQLVRRGPER